MMILKQVMFYDKKFYNLIFTTIFVNIITPLKQNRNKK